MSSIQDSSTELVEVRHTQASTSSAFIGGFWTNIFVECSKSSDLEREFDRSSRLTNRKERASVSIFTLLDYLVDLRWLTVLSPIVAAFAWAIHISEDSNYDPWRF
ncbi:MAG: hypothetical protein ACFB9N_09905 [Geitlerinemataceae cyanobacterium]